MVQSLWLATLVVIAGGAWMAYSRTRDPFHPAVVVAGPLAFVYGVWPFWLNTDSGLETLFGSEPLTEVAFLYLAALTAFFLGLLRFPNARTLYWMRRYAQLRTNPFTLELSPAARKRLFVGALILGALALAAYIQMIINVGGFVSAYSRAKGGGYSYSGYVGEAVLLAFPAIILLALSRQGAGRVRAIDILMALIIASPQLIQGTLGGRRGPVFLSIMVLFLAWFLARGRIPKLRTLMIGVGVAGFAVLFVMSQRGYLYLGSGGEVDLSRMESIFTPSTLEANDYVAGAATVLTDRYYDDYSWGAPHIITLLVRPIPRQIWPNKYQVAEALLGYKTVSGGDWGHYATAVGFAPPTGSAVGFIANLHGDFSWGVVIALFLLGWGFALLWERHRLRGGLWTLLFVEAMILTIYLPTQSFSAFYHRFFIMAAVSIIAWKIWIKKQ